MRLLIYGAGVIGSLYAALFSEAGYDTTLYARGKRLDALNQKGLIYLENGKTKKAKVSVISDLQDNDVYDFIFLTVRENQLYEALDELKNNKSSCIVTMVNSIDDYKNWENICGKGKIIPAFSGAGGSIVDDVLDAALTPKLIQPTTFAEISGMNTDRSKILSSVFRKSHIPYQQVKDMHIWQLCHLGMVVPIADAYYESDNPIKVGAEKIVMKKTARRLKRNFRFLYKNLGTLSPIKMHMFRLTPVPLTTVAMSFVFMSAFGNKFMYQHSMKAPDEMRQLHKQFYEYVKQNK